METVKFYSNRFKQFIECEVLEKRKKTWKLRTPKGIFKETIKKQKKYVDIGEIKKREEKCRKGDKGVSVYKFRQTEEEIETSMEEKVITKHVKQLNLNGVK